MAEQVIARSAARAQAQKRYFTGKLCINGHCAERFTSSGRCVVCTTEDRTQWAITNADKVRMQSRESEKRRDKVRKRETNRAWRAANIERLRDYASEYKKQNHEACLEYKRKSHHRHRDKCNAVSRQYRSDNQERLRRCKVDLYWSNPKAAREKKKLSYRLCRDQLLPRLREKYRNTEEVRQKAMAHARNRSARKKSAPGTHTAADLVAILKAQKHLCAYCRTDLRKTKKHVDHILPLALGGSNDKANLQYACASCNMSKGAKHPIAFAQELGRLL